MLQALVVGSFRCPVRRPAGLRGVLAMLQGALMRLLVSTSMLTLIASALAHAPQEVAQRAFSSTVTVLARDAGDRLYSSGSGFVVSPHYVVTNAHVVARAATVSVRRIGDPRPLSVAAIERFNEDVDLALLYVPDLEAPPLELAAGGKVVVGDTVYAVGSPLGFEGTFSPGMVSGLRNLASMSLIQVTAPISPGSSGGPLLDVQGRVLGVIVGTLTEGQNLNFAVPTTTLISWLREPSALTDTESPAQPDTPSATEQDPPTAGPARDVGVAPRVSVVAPRPITIPEVRVEVLIPEAQPDTPFHQTLQRPMAVVVDNLGGYPQHGLAPASQIHELPIEGGLTRLLLVFDRADPREVGPVRGARDYMVELSRSMDAVMVHHGGSPGALAAIMVTNAATLDASSSGALFHHAGAGAPHALFASGDALRAAVDQAANARARTVAGFIYRPVTAANDVSAVRVRYGATYETGFRYEPGVNAYRWIRNDNAASDAAGQAVLVDGVLVAAIEARAIPNDAEGRLYIPLRGGPATLYLRGKAVEGVWSLRTGLGVQFATAEGGVDLTPFKLWVVYTPDYGGIEAQ